MPALQLGDERRVGGVVLLRLSRRTRSRIGRDRKLEDRPPRFLPDEAVARVNEGDDRLPHILLGGEKAVVNSQLATTVADDDGLVRRESHALARAETEAHQPGAQLLCIPGRLFLEAQCQLVDISLAKHRCYRLKDL